MRTAVIALLAILALSAQETDATRLPPGEGKDLVANACLECHNSGNFRRMRMSKEEWADDVADMIDRGAKASAAEQEIIINYLAKNFGKDSKVLMNTAPVGELKIVLVIPTNDAIAIAAWREKNGPFKSFEDVLKVPGVDAVKLEAARSKMAF